VPRQIPLRVQHPATNLLLDGFQFREWTGTPEHPTPAENQVRDALEALDEDDRDLLLAAFYERLTYNQIAAKYGWKNRGSAHWAVKQAVARLAQQLEAMNEPGS
jgi:DNA-directed RNA polymerase specialized sigma24 family protein